MANTYYDHGTFPASNTRATSATMRQELDAVEAGFDKLPTNPIAGQGWSDPITVGAAVSAAQAVQYQQVAALAIAAVPDNSIVMAIALG